MKQKTPRQKQTDSAVCPKCHEKEWRAIPKWRYVFLVSSLPWLVAIILAITVHHFFLVFIPLLAFVNVKIASKRIPLSKCHSCHYIGPQMPTHHRHA